MMRDLSRSYRKVRSCGKIMRGGRFYEPPPPPERCCFPMTTRNLILKRPPIQVDEFTIAIQLTKGYVSYIDIIDADLAQFNWCVQEYPSTKRYAVRKTRDRSFGLHQLILERILGSDIPENIMTDHRDNDGLNNRRDNLRLASRSENQRNRPTCKNSNTGLKGASIVTHRNCYQSVICIDGKRKFLGYFSTAEEAHQAYCEAAVKYYGEFARFK